MTWIFLLSTKQKPSSVVSVYGFVLRFFWVLQFPTINLQTSCSSLGPTKKKIVVSKQREKIIK